MQAQFDDIFKQLGAAAAEADVEPSPAAEAEAAAAAADDESFQETIRRTMERMQASGDQATAAAANDGGADDLMAEMMKQFGAAGAGGLDGASSDEDFTKMLAGMMEQLTAKDILYEPMKDLDDKFPAWMAKNAAGLPKEERERYEEQQSFVRKIVAKFEEPGYADSNTKDREYVLDLMQKVSSPKLFVRFLEGLELSMRCCSGFEEIPSWTLLMLLRRCKPRARRLRIWWAT